MNRCAPYLRADLRRALPALLLCLAVSPRPAAQEVDLEAFSHLIDEVLLINIRARVLNSAEEMVWEANRRMYTIPGLEVEVRIPRENVTILAFFTPVKLKDSKILLQVQAQVWTSSPPETSGTRYSTTLNYIPAELGERIRFYPLGDFPDLTDASALSGSGTFNLEIEIEIVPYAEDEASGSS